LVFSLALVEPHWPRTERVHTDLAAHVRFIPVFVLGVLIARRDEFWLWLAARRWT